MALCATACSTNDSTDGEPTLSTPSNIATFEQSEDGCALVGGEEPANLVLYDNGTPPSLVWEPGEGDPELGALKATALFGIDGQFIDIRKEMPYPYGSGEDWSDKTTLTVRIKVQEGFSLEPGSRGTATVYATSVSPSEGYVHATSTTDLAHGSEWQTVACALDPVSFDTGSISAVGVRLRLETGGTSSSPMPSAAVLLVDTFALDGP